MDSSNSNQGHSPQTLAIGSLVLGLVAICLSFILIGVLFGAVGLLLGVIHLTNGRHPNAMAKWGVALSLAGVIAALGFGSVYLYFYKQIRQAMTSTTSTDSDLSKWQGVKAPDISVTTLDGRQIKLSELKGRRVVLDFWATWCPPCREELPHFEKLYTQTPPDQLTIVGISDESVETLKDFVTKNNLHYPIASASNLPPPFNQIQAIPTTFYIDRQGVIQTVHVGGGDYDEIKTAATSADFVGTPLSAPAAPAALVPASNSLSASIRWSKTIPGAQALCVGAWQHPGANNILVAAGAILHVLDLSGTEVASISLPDTYRTIECGRGRGGKPRLLGYSNWGHSVQVTDETGKLLWECRSLVGVDGAHWGDLDGDGVDEMVAGMNGFGGLKVLDPDGKELWSANLGNVWNQAIVPAAPGRPALVLATEAAGKVHLFDSKGAPLRTLQPEGGYYAQMMAQATEGTNIQIAAINGDTTVAFDPFGKVAWHASAIKDHAGWRVNSFTTGALAGDGTNDWVLMDGDGNLVVATPDGAALASIPGLKSISAFALVPSDHAGTPGLLITLDSSAITAHGFTSTITTNTATASAK